MIIYKLYVCVCARVCVCVCVRNSITVTLSTVSLMPASFLVSKT